MSRIKKPDPIPDYAAKADAKFGEILASKGIDRPSVDQGQQETVRTDLDRFLQIDMEKAKHLNREAVLLHERLIADKEIEKMKFLVNKFTPPVLFLICAVIMAVVYFRSTDDQQRERFPYLAAILVSGLGSQAPATLRALRSLSPEET